MTFRKFLLIICLAFACQHGKSQTSTDRVQLLLNQSDWFTLETEYPLLKDSITLPALRWFSEAMLGLKFNQFDQAITAIDTLLIKYQGHIGFENISWLFLCKSYILKEQEKYAQSADLLTSQH